MLKKENCDFNKLVENILLELGTNPTYGGFQTSSDYSGGMPVQASLKNNVQAARAANAATRSTTTQPTSAAPPTTDTSDPGTATNRTSEQLTNLLRDPDFFKKFQNLVNDPSKKINSVEDVIKQLQ